MKLYGYIGNAPCSTSGAKRQESMALAFYQELSGQKEEQKPPILAARGYIEGPFGNRIELAEPKGGGASDRNEESCQA